MTLNIRDPEAHKLARKLADRTGETMTRAVTEALRERLARVSRAHLHQKLRRKNSLPLDAVAQLA
jgi:hypothetical protein